VRFEAETRLAALLNASGRAREAYAHLEAAEAMRALAHPRWSARHTGILAHTLHGLGRIDESAAAFVEAERVSREIDDLDLLERTLNNHAGLLAACGDTQGSIAKYREALAVARKLQAPRLIAWVQQNLAYACTLAGEFESARAACREASAIDHGVAMVSRWLAATELRIETLTATPSNERLFDALRAFDGAERSSDGLSAMVSAGAVILARQAAGEPGNEIAERYAALAAPADEPWIGEAAPRLRADLTAAIRARVEAAAAAPFALGAQATLALLDARIAVRERRRSDADALAKIAIERFKTLGWPVEEAYAREIRGGAKEALEIFRCIGAHAEVARLTNLDERVARKRGEGSLTIREREIANLIAAGKTNREVAQTLVISERTVETHVASIYGKFGVSNRKDLIAVLRPPG
jgi:DNA-binding CsgD family transcriptional regulator/tetratricopeptide (TPR) repeat protein